MSRPARKARPCAAADELLRTSCPRSLDIYKITFTFSILKGIIENARLEFHSQEDAKKVFNRKLNSGFNLGRRSVSAWILPYLDQGIVGLDDIKTKWNEVLRRKEARVKPQALRAMIDEFQKVTEEVEGAYQLRQMREREKEERQIMIESEKRFDEFNANPLKGLLQALQACLTGKPNSASHVVGEMWDDHFAGH